MWGLRRGGVGSKKILKHLESSFASDRAKIGCPGYSLPCVKGQLNAALQIVGEEGVEGSDFLLFFLASGYFDIIIIISLLL